MKFFRNVLLALAAAVSAAASSAWADPPGRVGRISLISGTAVVRTEYYSEGQEATVNWPLTSGNTLSTPPGSRAEVRIGSTAIRLDGDSEIEFSVVDDQQLRLRLLHGTVAARIRDPEQARQFELFTAQGRVELREAGAYRFETGRAPETTAVTVFQGDAAFSGEGLALAVRAGQRAEIFGSANPNYVMAPQAWDGFDTWCVARDRHDDAARSVRYVPREMTGYEDLDDYGDWRESADYGPLWYPRAVPIGWAPYRSGHWIWVEPWGWTWVDDAPWGFAPFHYGRWVFLGGFWAWAPGPIAVRPVYAPALVAWIGRPGWQVSFAFGAAPAVGWFPLGPREVFVPGYRCSTLYVHRVNAPHVTNVTIIENARRGGHDRVQHVHRFRPDAVTVVPTHVISRGERVGRFALRGEQARSIDTTPALAAPAVERPRPSMRDRGRGDGPPRSSSVAGAPAAPGNVIGGGVGTPPAAQLPASREARIAAPERPFAGPRPDTEHGRRDTIRQRDPQGEGSAPPSRGAERPAAESQPRVFAAPQPRATELAPAAADPDRGQHRTIRQRDLERAAPPLRGAERGAPEPRTGSFAPAPRAAEPGRSTVIAPARPERERQSVQASPRVSAPPARYDMPAPPRHAVREGERRAPAADPPRSESRAAPVRESRDREKGHRSAQRDEPKAIRARPN